ncbi:SMP-30/gluconolaconase/LRE-like region family protein [Paraburkholderia sp. 5N]|uniref:SMP-30/gluconolaconase/LRE-like region family protein n=2 Tax=Paraburkholderia elongata TaxID=2675747 RepID=A0A972NSQ0_9BURK|nr:SMP-30/gluconolaconase/LRE-like region family protein [Paraburkholderia elongata]
MWDENGSGIEQYTSGHVTQGIGAHGEAQGDTLTANGTDIWSPRQFGRPCPTCSFTSGLVFDYDRTSGNAKSYLQVSCDTTERKSDVIKGIATWGNVWAASDNNSVCQRVRLYSTANAWIRDIPATDPGAIAFDRNGNLLVAQEAEGAVLQISQAGTTILHTLTLPAGEVPHSLYFDPTTQYLWIGDAGPDENVKIYDTRTFTLVSTFGTPGGYLDTTTGTKGQTGSLRFARIDGIGKDASGNIYILSQPWGAAWDNGRTGTNLYAYSPTGTLLYNLQGLNFEGIGSPDPATDAQKFYSGYHIFSCAAYPCSGGNYVASTVDPFDYPGDLRLVTDPAVYAGRGLDFGMVYDNGVNQILLATDQDPDNFALYHFNAANGDIAIPQGWITNVLGMASTHIRKGFALDDQGGVWASEDKGACSAAICYWPLTGFASDGTPQWGTMQSWPIPATIGTLGRVIYLPATDTLILANIIGTDWTSIGTRVEVYHGWVAGNQTNPVVINLTSTNPKSIAAAGNYLFVGYVHTVPNVDAFNLTTGTLDNTFINSNPNNVYVGNDVDSMYGIRAVLRSNGEYVVTKDDYNGTSIVVYRWTP